MSTGSDVASGEEEEHTVSMLLSRVAESVYWMGRYLERAEATARLLRVHTELFLDMPKAAGVGWLPLLAVTGSAGDFAARHETPGEEDVIRFLAVDSSFPGSILSSLTAARANLRVNRALLPEPTWEVLNGLYLEALASAPAAVDRRTRLGWMRTVVRQCHLLAGMIASTMNRDHTYAFLEIGRHIERADMTTRVLDVGAAILLDVDGRRSREAYADSLWSGVLKSVAADQMFRLSSQAGLSVPEAVGFLLKHPQFPRSVEHCLTELSRSLLELPNHAEAMAAAAAVQTLLVEADPERLAVDGLHEFVDAVQLGIARLHTVLGQAYFLTPATGALAATS